SERSGRVIIDEANTDSGIQDILDIESGFSRFWSAEMRGFRVFQAVTVCSVALVALAVGVRVRAQDPAGSSVWDGVYTEEQARRGLAIYKERCVMCHGEKLEGGPVGPALSGEDFMGDWQGKSV